MRKSSELPTETAGDRTILRAVRDLKGRATVGDVMARTGQAQSEAEASLRRLLETRRGHLEVGEAGTLVYSFDPSLVRRDDEPFWSRLRTKAWDAFKTGFKVWTLVMLAVYLVIFVALLVAAVFGLKRGSDNDGWGGGGRGGGRHGGGHFHFPNFLFWYWIWSPGWGWGRPYYGHRWEERVGGSRKAQVPLYKKVFAFVFGPDRPEPTQAQKDRSLVRLVRSRRGVVTVADLVQHTGLRRHEAEEEMARLMAAYDGDVKVSRGGEMVYVFPELMVSAHGRVTEQPPDPAWRRLEPPREVTGNSPGANLAIGAVNAFNLIAAATAPLFIFPRLALGGTAAWIGLVWVPLVFSSAFFGIPLLRKLGVARENRRREESNLRKVLLSSVFRTSLVGDGAQPLTASTAGQEAGKALGRNVDPKKVDAELLRLTADWDATVEAGGSGQAEYRFDEVRSDFLAAEEMRRALALETRQVGEIVYSSADSVPEESNRAAAVFDRELAGGAVSPGSDPAHALSRYAPTDARVAYVDDFELVAFDEEMRRGRSAKR
jgi:hypothetical protein